MFNPPEPVSDDELEAVLAAALRTHGTPITPVVARHIAGVVAGHLVTALAVEGIRAVRSARGNGLG